MRPAVADELRSVLQAQSRPLAEALLKAMVAKYAHSAPELSAWLELNVPESLSVFSLPKPLRQRLRTSNAAERVNQELKRRTRVVRVFPNSASLLRLVSARLLEIAEDWESASFPYLNLTPQTSTP
jgi:transposase-like protein